MNQLMRSYSAALQAAGRSPDTIRAYTSAPRLAAAHAGCDILALTPDDVADWLGDPGMSDHTRRAYYRHLSRFLTWCRDRGIPAPDALAGLPAPRSAGWRPKPVPDEQLRAMLTACTSSRETAVLLLGAYAGLRRAEIARFQGGQIDPWSRTLSVAGKGGKVAEIGLAPVLAKHARKMPDGWWFPSPTDAGVPVRRETVTEMVRRVAVRAGSGAVTPHQLRHWHATTLIRAGVPITTVRDQMRHRDVSTTQWYVLVADRELVSAAGGLPDLTAA